MSKALIMGASQGFGRALLALLVEQGWTCVVDARDAPALQVATAGMPGVRAVSGDVIDPRHRATVVAAAGERLDLLVHNASALGPSPLPRLADYPLDALRRVYEVDVFAPLALTQLALPALRAAPAPTVVVLSSDAAVEAYPGWGGYGSAKAALDHLAAVLAVEHPDLRVYAFDPGDVRTSPRGRVPRRGHLRPRRPRSRRAGPPASATRTPRQRPIPCHRPAHGDP